MNVLISKARVATPNDPVLKSECAYTFHSPFSSAKGIVVNIETFQGTVEELALPFMNDGIFLRIVKKRTPVKVDAMDTQKTSEEPTKLGIGVEGGFASEDEKFDILTTYSIVGLKKATDSVSVEIIEEIPYTESNKSSFDEVLIKSVDSILHHSGLAVQQDLSVWELDDEPKPVSKYTINLPFLDNGKIISPDPSTWKCESTGATDNLWLNLSDGYIGGGRKNWDGSGGSNGALDHFLATDEQYPLVVKLGTITADINTADCFSYAKDEDGPVKIPNLAELLEKRGIKVAAMQKTVKSTAELEVELNATYAFDAITEAGADLVSVSGPCLQGLQNLGNSCYINSVVQLMLSGTIAELSKRYGESGLVTKHTLFKGIDPKDATADLLTQTAKLSLALTSGAFSIPEEDLKSDGSIAPQYRLQPRMFKHAIAGDHAEFRTGQQQDAAHFAQYMLEQLDRAERGGSQRLFGGDANAIYPSSHLFSFHTTTRLVCSTDQKIKYKEAPNETMLSLPIPMEKATLVEIEPEQKRHKSEQSQTKDEATKPVPTIAFSACLDSWSAETTVHDYRWSHLGNVVATSSSQTKLTNFPRYLLVQIQRYTMGTDWTPQKLEVNLDIPQELDMTQYKSIGPQEGESLVPDEEKEEDTNTIESQANQVDENAISQLMDMGFSFNGCKRALITVGGSDVQAAMNWIFEHNMDEDFNDPISEEFTSTLAPPSGDAVDDGVVMSLTENLGCFTADQVRAALKHTNGAADRAADWLFSHVDDVDSAIAALKSKINATSSLTSETLIPLDDGEGKYTMVGMISHIGKHTGSGHYVAHLKRENDWVIFNDEKVAISASPPFVHAYIYLFQRKDTIGVTHPQF
mmetsp:Transcript_4554/g.5270  ORF Transcript_4554/g.5270 Transcript_4554/m.5270 type:complete len:862 (+) Transcript_4554:40-2625(+)|eukprot:CAMPEP_0194166766 /NCGR_PEP_ID=MMETSP0154-20130528/2282_1 /TAXON_ID=1049557 /ORGANISM="Thalassiothrix antarctica, Strain L6-D1" /LENGTH=861 /DNA_ID=CAMNT_0038877531 /DNA_START=12 /DNA_END=2597 /DNA_ORIENTATION=+